MMNRTLSPGKLVLLCFLCLGAGCSSPILDVSRQTQLIQYQQEIEDAVVKSEWLSMQKIGVEPYSSSPLLKITYRPTHARTNRRYANGVETLRAPTSGATYSWSQRMIVTHQPLISWTLESPDQWLESRRVAFHMAAVEQAIALYTEVHDVLNHD